MIVHINNLSKSFRNTKALDSIDLRIAPGIHGLLGPNGAGKSTLMQILATILDADNGDIFYGEDCNLRQPFSVKKRLGYLPQNFGMYKFLSIEEALKSVAIFKSIPPLEEKEQIALALERTNLTEYRKRKVGQLSGGMLRRLGIAQALLGEPDLLILDEPTVGLDPAERISFRKLIRKYNNGKRIILLSSHIVSDIESLCDTVTIINRGKKLVSGSLQEIQNISREKVITQTISPSELAKIEDTHTVINFSYAEDKYRVRYLVSKNECGNVQNPSLEDSYTYIIQQGIL